MTTSIIPISGELIQFSGRLFRHAYQLMIESFDAYWRLISSEAVSRVSGQDSKLFRRGSGHSISQRQPSSFVNIQATTRSIFLNHGQDLQLLEPLLGLRFTHFKQASEDS